MAEDISSWAAREGLSDQTADFIEEEGFTTVDDLKELSPEDISDVFKNKLKGKDFIALKKAVSRLSLDVDRPQSESHGTQHQRSYRSERQQSHGSEGQQSCGSERQQSCESEGQQSCGSEGQQSSGSQHQQSCGSQHQQSHESERQHTTRNYGAVSQPREGHVRSVRERFDQPQNTGAVRGQAAAAPPKATMGFFRDFFGFSDNAIEEEFRFLMLGKTGSGKSTTGNTILGEQKFNSSITFSSVTSDCDLQRTTKKGRMIEVMDCPGLYDTSKSQAEVAQVVVQAVGGMHPGPHAILYVSRLGRYTAEEFGVFKRLKALFDDRITDYMIVLFTGGDDLEREKKQLAELLLNAPRDLLQVIQECGHRCIVFNNTAKDKKSQVEKLLDEVRKMKTKNGDQPHYQCPRYETIGNSLETEVQRRLAEVAKRDLEREHYILELETKTKDAQAALEEFKAEIKRKEKERDEELEKENEMNRQKEQRLKLELQAKQEEKEIQIRREKELQQQLKLEKEEFLRRQEEERRREKEKLLEKEKEKRRLEKKRLEEEREDRRKKEEAYREQLNRAKDEVAKNENPGFMETAANAVMSVFSTVKSWIW